MRVTEHEAEHDGDRKQGEAAAACKAGGKIWIAN